jgi:mono/diheme cytochrome c family protein
MRTSILPLLAAVVASACASTPKPRPTAPLVTSEVAWNQSGAAVGPVTGVAELGETTLVTSDRGATIFSGGAVAGADRSTGYSWAGTIAAPDGTGTWLVAITKAGELRRVRSRSSLEPVADRFGLAGTRVRAACSASPHDTVFLLEGSLARSDGRQVQRIDGSFASIACGPGVIAATTASGIRVLGAGQDRLLALPSPLVAVSGSGRLFAASSTHVYAADAAGSLARVHEASAPIASLSASGDGAWFSTAGTLGYTDGASAAEATDARVGATTALVASPSGDAWANTGGALVRLSRSGKASPTTHDDGWKTAIAPIQQKTCATCHGPGGSSGLDLSTAAAWNASRDAIERRVVATRDMPPVGTPFSDGERDAVRRFVTAR